MGTLALFDMLQIFLSTIRSYVGLQNGISLPALCEVRMPDNSYNIKKSNKLQASEALMAARIIMAWTVNGLHFAHQGWKFLRKALNTR
jgi:hypothetical protein